MANKKALSARDLVLSARPRAFAERREGVTKIKIFYSKFCEYCGRWGTGYEVIGSGDNAAEAWYNTARNMGLIEKG